MIGPRDPQAELGPALPARFDVYARAREIAVLAQVAAECATAGPRCDLRRATEKLRQIAALAGETP